ncbi:MAG: chemotaxis-specific protein-glutamate methyltransferase CheB [Gammaproteobacteria bacterium]|nr:chemotaxis-specific protein-glutamate methyltransferase CheB [Gammaproteobacteria bacterium]
MLDKIKTLIVDDSLVIRQVLSDLLGDDPGIELLPAAADPIFAMETMQKQWPDVIILDIEMPRMDGISFLRKIMAERPTPVIICSTMAKKGSRTSHDVISLGAVDVISKPQIGLPAFLEETKSTLINSVKAAAKAAFTATKGDAAEMPKTHPSSLSKNKVKSIIIGHSTPAAGLTAILGGDSRIELLAATADPASAVQHMQQQWPDVIILDIETPHIDGLAFLHKIMNERPTPIVVCSALTADSVQTSMQMLSAGAVNAIAKPASGQRNLEAEISIIDTVRAAADADLHQIKRNAKTPVNPIKTHDNKVPAERIIAMGACTGGPRALEFVLQHFPVDAPGTLIVQHMPAGLTAAFARHLNKLCEVEVKEAEHRDPVIRGQVLIAPGDRHMRLQKDGGQYYVELKNGPLINRFRPSIDVLFRSVAQNAGENAVGAIMTGMSGDGAAGLEEMHKAGAFSVAQNKETCAVYGMAGEAVKHKAVDNIVPLEHLAFTLLTQQKP